MVAKTTTNKLKAGKNKPINKWLIVAGVAVVAALGVLVVRYSGASGEAWSVNSTSVQTYGGQMKTKTDGTAYWVGTSNNNIGLKMVKAGEYCVDGSFGENSSTASISITNGQMGGLVRRFTGSSGKFTQCYYLARLDKPYYLLGLNVEKGTFVVNRFWLRNSLVYYPNDTLITRTGGVLKTSNDGSATWTGVKGTSLTLNLSNASGEYCFEGIYNLKGTEGSVGTGDGAGHGMGGVFSGNSGSFSQCMNVKVSDKTFGLSVDAGSIKVNRIIKK